MYAAREDSVSPADPKATHQSSSNDYKDHPSPDQDSDNQSATKERFAAAHSDSEGRSPSEYDSAVSEVDPYGSQYSSEGELCNLESDTGHRSSEASDSERFGAI